MWDRERPGGWQATESMPWSVTKTEWASLVAGVKVGSARFGLRYRSAGNFDSSIDLPSSTVRCLTLHFGGQPDLEVKPDTTDTADSIAD